MSQKPIANLRCPIQHTPLRAADPDLLEQVNAAIESGDLSCRGGHVLTQQLDEALVNEQGCFLWPVHDGIASLVLDDGISLDQLLELSRRSPKGRASIRTNKGEPHG